MSCSYLQEFQVNFLFKIFHFRKTDHSRFTGYTSLSLLFSLFNLALRHVAMKRTRQSDSLTCGFP